MSRSLSTRVPAFAAALIVLATLEPLMAAEPDPRLPRTVSVSAVGAAQAEPDAAAIQTGVTSEADTAREALNRTNAAMAKVIEGLKAAGIKPADIQTIAVQLNPRYKPNKGGQAPEIGGYTASNQVRIHVLDLKRLGELLDLAITLGANQMGGISFEVSTAEMLRDTARTAAMANARRRAELYATAAGATLGQVVTISESIALAGLRPAGLARGMAMSAEAVPVEGGSQRLEATVHVTWELK